MSRLPADDKHFDREESGEDADTVCAINRLRTQVKPAQATALMRESTKDPVVATVRDGCHKRQQKK